MSDRVAIVTDIHASLQALEAALARIEELGIERIYCGGDLVGYGPHPNEACALLAERQIPTIYGSQCPPAPRARGRLQSGPVRI